jgi:hypothetical protein
MGMAGAIAGLAFGMVLRTFVPGGAVPELSWVELTFILLLFPANGSIRFAGGLGDRSLPS